MASTDVSSGRARPARPSVDALGWLRENLFSSWYNALISIVLLFLIYQLVSGLAGFLLHAQGWPAVVNNLKLLMTWIYPPDQLWRPQVAFGLVALLLGLSAGVWRGIVLMLAIGFASICVLLALPTFLLAPVPAQVALPAWLMLLAGAALTALGYVAGRAGGERIRWPLVVAWILIYPTVIVIVRGFGGALPLVGTNLWGGLMLTILLSVSGIVLSFPLGILLALGRRSDLPVVKWFCIAYIELIRGVPLVTVLYM
ncbi:MAG: ABC transporter permease subunit, partial [Chloroflexales bacterium]|nr:ABC transporter permease subunit [Chloroflexales bacterium]